MEEENFASLNAEIVAETSGTSVTPQLVQGFNHSSSTGVRSKHLLQKFAEHRHIHDEYFRQVSWYIAQQNEESTRLAYNVFVEASFKLGRITDCDPKIGKKFLQCFQTV